MRKIFRARALILLVLISISFLTIFRSNLFQDEDVVSRLDKTEINEIKENFSETLMEASNFQGESLQENVAMKILKISNNIYSSVEENSIPDLELLSILSKQMMNFSREDIQKMSEEKMKILLIQFSSLSTSRKNELKSYYRELIKASKLNNSKILNDILNENPNSPVVSVFIKIKG